MRIWHGFLAILVCGLFGLPHLAEASSKTVTVEGYGETRQESVQKALAEAIKQVQGVSVVVRESVGKNLQKLKFNVQDEYGGERSGEIELKEDERSLIRQMTEGIVQTYRILESQKEGKEWRSKLEVTMGQYEAPGGTLEKLKKCAILPFDTNKASFMVSGNKIDFLTIAQDLNQKLVTGLTQTRKLAVMDRENTGAYMREKHLLLSGDAPLSEQLKLGQVLGVDYLLLGRLKEFRIESEPYTMSLTGEKFVSGQAQLLLSYRVIVMATQQIKCADEVSIILDDKAIRRLNLQPTDDLKDMVLHLGSQAVIEKIMENLYPMCVIRKMESELVLNQGGDGLRVGDQFAVYSAAGEPMLDPYTGENLGGAETELGVLEITRVSPKISYAKLVTGDLKSISEGAICRKHTP